MQTHSFRDFDAFSSAVGDVDAVMMLQNPKRHSWTISHVYLPGIHVQLGRLGSGNIVQGESWSNGYLLYLPLTDTCEYSANGTVLPKHSFMILEPGCDFCVSTKFEHDWCSIFVPTNMVAHDPGPVESSSGPQRTTCRVAQVEREVADQFRALVDQVMAASAKYPQFESSPAATRAAAELLKVGTAVLRRPSAGDSHHEGRPRVPRQEIIRRSQQLFEQRAGQTILVGELAAAVDVSERTLRTCFHEYFGVGPARYLQLTQLHQVRRALRAADPAAVSVGEVLLAHGELEISRFAGRYRRLFGELPSETLRAQRR